MDETRETYYGSALDQKQRICSVVFSPHSQFCLIREMFFFQAEDGIRDRSPSRGLGDVYKRQRLVDAQLTLS